MDSDSPFSIWQCMCLISQTDVNAIHIHKHHNLSDAPVFIIGVWEAMGAKSILYLLIVVYPILPYIMEYDSASHKLRLSVGEK